jgi:hypothetical protein
MADVARALVRLFLENETLFFCDSCIALKLGVSLEEARGVLTRSGHTLAIRSKRSACDGCRRVKDVFSTSPA